MSILNLILVYICLLVGEVHIPTKCCVPNQSPGYCAWASLETLGNYLRIKPLYGLMESRKKDPPFVRRTWWVDFDGFHEMLYSIDNNYGAWDSIQEKLISLGVKHKIQRNGVFNKTLIRESIRENLGCLVAVNSGLPTCDGSHGIIITDFSDTGYKYVDTNNINVDFYGTMQWFDRNWDGLVVVVYK